MKHSPLLACLLLIFTANVASAVEYNQSSHMQSGSTAKVNKYTAASYRTASSKKNNYSQPKRGCGNQAVGNVVVKPGANAPREVITVIKGDVVNVNNGRGCR